MIIIGVDFHPEFQQIALMDSDSGEFQEKRLGHREEAGDVLSRANGRRAEGSCRYGSQWARALVRTTAGRVAG